MSSSDSTAPASGKLWNVPNQITTARIALALVMFAAMAFGWYGWALGLFIVAAGTDWMDGYWARKYNLITQLGRILDPFADKLIICGAYTFLAAVPPLADGTRPSGVAAWMAVVVLGRELLVTALRSFIEQHGGDFSARWVGKWKMVLQCAAVAWSLYALTHLAPGGDRWQTEPAAWLTTGLHAVVWSSVLLTLYSGVEYVRAGAKVLLKAPD
ncbi:MAG: CDP-diacylglycerol--glycerol-3-phosphate 3-phosphatidyltransferase [Planctomycetota bacterium]